MTTHGTYGIFKDDHYYMVYNHHDMFLYGHPSFLMAEASEIARNGDWDAIVDGWSQKKWVDAADDDIEPQHRPHMHHPDGLVCTGRNWTETMVPRESVDVLSHHQKFALADAKPRKRKGYDPAKEIVSPVSGRPSWRAAAAMPVMRKHKINPDGDSYSVIVDADSNQVVLFKVSSSGHHVPVAVADMDDADGLQEIADWAARPRVVDIDFLDPKPSNFEALRRSTKWLHHTDKRFEYHSSVGGPSQVPDFDPYETYHQRAQAALRTVASSGDISYKTAAHIDRNLIINTPLDGQWLRPDGLRPLNGTPIWFPAQETATDTHTVSYDSVAYVPSAGWKQCAHVGVRAKKRCLRFAHTDKNHRYQ